MKKTSIISIILIIVICAITFSACGFNSDNNSGQQNTIKIVGSTSVEVLMSIMKDKYQQKNTDISILIDAPGSSAGIKAIIDGNADTGISSRDLTAEEKAQGIVEHIVALDGMAVIINNNNPIQNLTTEQIKKIYKGEITNWTEVGGVDKEIILVIREAGSGTRDSFEELTGLIENNFSMTAEQRGIFGDSTGVVVQSVSTKEAAIGYISFGSLTDTVKAVNVDGVECSADNIKNNSYKISRSFLILTKGRPKGEVKAFIDWALGDQGQQIVSENKLISAK